MLLLAAFVVATPPAVASPTENSYPNLSAGCAPRGLEQANVWISDYEADGEARPDPESGRVVPVLMVHGWTGNSAHLSKPLGNFSRTADLGTIGESITPSSRTVVGILQYLGDTDVYTFDYHDASAQWVTSDQIAAPLANSIRCLGQNSGQKVIVVAHSMGGLAVRQALAQDPGLLKDLSQVITFGTPNTGSDIARSVSAGGSGGSINATASRAFSALLRSALSSCGSATTTSLNTGTPCDWLPAQASAFESDAGRALRTGSTELSLLKPWPTELPVHALYGDTTLTMPRMGFLGLPLQTEDVRVGDVVVGHESATARATTRDSARCRYTISAVHSLGEQFLRDMKLKTVDEVGRDLMEGGNSPCYHGSLMRTQQLVNAMIGYVVDDVDSRGPIEDVVGELLIPAGACTQWEGSRPIQLSDGQGENFDDGQSGTGILATRLVGTTDLTGDGRDDAVLVVQCTGTPAALCCAGRASIMSTVLALDLSGATPVLIGTPFSGGSLSSSEGDVYAKIYDDGTDSPRLEGTDVLAYEYPTYDLEDPDEAETIACWFRHTLKNGEWTRVSE
jgi:pimeloyl-ACP methyl ester carboxylesterase